MIKENCHFQKSNITNDDKELIEKKGTIVMERMKELEALTIKFEYFLGLSDAKIDNIEHHLDQVFYIIQLFNYLIIKINT